MPCLLLGRRKRRLVNGKTQVALVLLLAAAGGLGHLQRHQTYPRLALTQGKIERYHRYVVAYAVEAGIGFRYEFLVGPAHLSCTVMPQEARDAAVAKIRRFVEHGAPADENKRAHYAYVSKTLLRLASVIEANCGPHDPKLLDEFMTFTNDLDRTRGQVFVSINPDLLQFIEATGLRWTDNLRFAR